MITIDKDEYFNHPGISNSKMSHLLPEDGGNIHKFQHMLENEQENLDSEEINLGSEEINLGKAGHKYIELRGDANLTPLDYPGPLLRATLDDVVAEVGDDFDLHKFTTHTLSTVVLASAKKVGYGKGWKDDTIIKKVVDEGTDYLTNLILAKSDTKVILVPNNITEKFDGIIASIKKYNGIINPEDLYPDCEIKDEVPVVWEEKGVTLKALIDRIIYNPTTKIITILDWKTSSIPRSKYFGYEHETINLSTGDIETEYVLGEMFKRSVHRQLAMYVKAAKQLYPTFEDIQCKVGYISTNAPYEIDVVEIHPRWISVGERRIDLALKLINEIPTT